MGKRGAFELGEDEFCERRLKTTTYTPCECSRFVDHPSQARPGIHALPDRLHVVTMLENPLRWHSRYWNYWMFERECEAAGAILYTAEVAFGERHFEVTEDRKSAASAIADYS